MSNDSLQARLVRFIISGGLSTLLHFSVMALMIFMKIDAVVATMTGAVAGAILNYILQYHYTFRSRKSHFQASVNFLMASALAWISNLLLFVFFHNQMQIIVPIAQVVTTGIVTVQNYFIYKFIFHHQEEH